MRLCARRLGLGQDDVFLQKIPISFDPSVQVHPLSPASQWEVLLASSSCKQAICFCMQELFSPLSCGGKLVLAVPGGEKDTQYLARLKASQGVTFCIYVPSQLDAALQVVHAVGDTTCLHSF